jgi:hypothetical protein
VKTRLYTQISVATGLVGISLLAGCGGSSNSVKTYAQIDRLARPAVNEVFATVANNRHMINDTDNPTDDHTQLANDISGFMTNTAGRSAAITTVVTSVLVPDTIIADLSQTGSASYLGVETNGATGGKFGGRKLSDDVVDISLGVIFGNTVPALGLAPDDGKEIATLTSDNVSDTTAPKHYLDGSLGGAPTFPYVGAPQ